MPSSKVTRFPRDYLHFVILTLVAVGIRDFWLDALVLEPLVASVLQVVSLGVLFPVLLAAAELLSAVLDGL